MRISERQLEKAVEAFNAFGFTTEREGYKGVVVFDNIFCLHKMREQWRTTDEFLAGLTVHEDGELIYVELGTLH